MDSSQPFFLNTPPPELLKVLGCHYRLAVVSNHISFSMLNCRVAFQFLWSKEPASDEKVAYIDTPSEGATLGSGKYSYDYEGPNEKPLYRNGELLLPTEGTFPGILSTSEMTKTPPSRPVPSSCTLRLIG